MPRTVDHAARRRQIIDGLLRVAGRSGLHAVTMRSVAAEAGVSLRLVQYYFETKAGLMHGALEDLGERSARRWEARLAQSPAPTSARAVLEAFADVALPTDEESRMFQLLWTSFAVLAMTDRDLAEQPFVDRPRRLERQIADVLRRARDAGELAAALDPSTEAARLLALNHGLGTGVLVGQRSAASARRIWRYHLDQLLGPADRRP